jgi:uncharacterized protein (TIGR00375 family)
MNIFADLHIHSRHSRATSRQLDVDNLEKWAKVKGISLLGTGDFTHPEWIKELKEKLVTEENGIYRTKTGFPFILQSEISLMYTQGKGRRVHLVLLAPDFDVVAQVTEYLKSKGRVDYDGRPIFNIPCPEFTEKLMSISEDIEIIPAHVWTPWFGLFGSKTGFDSVDEAFQEQKKHIHALETGLSSNPAMNWRLSALDKYSLVSFSDLHSFWPWILGSEATIFDIDLTYKNLINALRTKQGLSGTIEVDPAYGKYHWDGHRMCSVRLKPEETMKMKGICPKCGKPLTIGVEYRVEQLADRPAGFKPDNAPGFKTLIPVSEILAKLLNTSVASQKIWREYNKLTSAFGNEMDMLLNVPFDELKKISGELIAQKIIDNRNGNIKIDPGYDGEYGVPVFGEDDGLKLEEIKIRQKQTGLGDFI